MSRRLLPHPLPSLSVFLLWAVISNAASPGLLLLGGLLTFVVLLLTRPFWRAPPRLIRPWLALRFCADFAADVFTANWRVAWRVIGPLHRLSPAFVEVPLEIYDPFLATLLVSVASLLVLFGMRTATTVYFEVALLLALLGFVGTVALCKFLLRGDIIE
jgi:multicomponent K+:H+ antiporter subunit E